MTATSSDFEFMGQALALARKGLYSTHPNPRIGCVIVRDGDVVGTGWHERAGQPHAEVMALREAGEAARGACVYVNLEPCCHQGRTPPCTGFLIDAGVKRVVAAIEDPNPQVAGGGIESLRGAGIDVEVGVMRRDAEKLNRGFFHRACLGKPWITLKVAASMDGRTAMQSGESRWITGEPARRDVHHWRAMSSAIMTGSGTVMADDPELTVRGIETTRQPLRVVVDSDLSSPAGARVFRGPGATLIATANEEYEYTERLDDNVEVVYLPGSGGTVDLAALMTDLAQREVNELLVEAGPTLSGAMMRADLVDEILVYIAPRFLGDDGLGMFKLPGIERLDECEAREILDIRQFGKDLRILMSAR